jgi:hypothetical protein
MARDLEAMLMLTIRYLGGVSLLLMGSTWLWLTPAFAGRGVSTSGVLWAATRALCLLAITGFCLATWGLFARQTWWELVAEGSAALGALTLVTYWVAAVRGGEPAGTASWNVFVHVVMIAGLLVLLLVPSLERWVDHHVMSG